MAGETDLGNMLSSLQPRLLSGEFVFCTLVNGRYGDHRELSPIACFTEEEGLSLLLPREKADQAGLVYDAIFRCITLGLHSSLEAVGLTAAVASCLADIDISANVIAAFHHDHILVPAGRAEEALAALQGLTG